MKFFGANEVGGGTAGGEQEGGAAQPLGEQGAGWFAFLLQDEVDNGGAINGERDGFADARVARRGMSQGVYKGDEFVGLRAADANAAFRSTAGLICRNLGEIGLVQFDIDQAILHRAAHLNFDGVDEWTTGLIVLVRREGGVLARLPFCNTKGARIGECSVGIAMVVEERIDLLFGACFFGIRGHGGGISRVDSGTDLDGECPAIVRTPRGKRGEGRQSDGDATDGANERNSR